ncbi:MAG: hypothetical protein ACRBDL_10760 [Alphaproteobacteria bacterium]
MISYYKSKHPGLFIYLALLIATVTTFLFIGTTSKTIGLFSVLWGSFMVMRTLSLYEISEHFAPITNTNLASKNRQADKSFLPHDLAQRKKMTNHMHRGLYAFHALTPRTLVWFIMAILYCASYILLDASLSSSHDIIEYICIAFMIGGAFWAGQTYAYSHYASKLIGLITTTLFGVSLYHGSGLQYPMQLDLHHITLFFMSVYSTICLLYALRHGFKKSFNILCGIAVFILILCYSSFQISVDTHAVWISGISLFSIFWVRSHNQLQKQYVLYQCE